MLAPGYRAFISYAHEDRAHAEWLVRTIEAYRVPRNLPLPDAAPRRIRPVFLDRLELRADGQLDTALQDAMRRSDALLVVCSPHAVASGKVDEEIRSFAAMGRGERIFPVIVAGHPMAIARGYPPQTECFPAALLELSGPPTAADIRPGKGSRREARVRLVASLLGVRLDDLRRRDERRRMQRLAGIAAVAATAAAITTAFGVVAWVARNQAELERQRAEHTVTFLTDLLQAADPSRALGRELTARELVDEGSVLLRAADVPADLRSDMRILLASVYQSLGVRDKAKYFAELALEERGRESKRDTAYADALELHAVLAMEDGKLDEALRAEQDVVCLRESLRDRRKTAISRSLMGAILVDASRFDEAGLQLQRALDEQLELYPAGDRELGQTYNRIATLHQERRDMPAAIENFRRALEVARKVHGDLHPGVATMLNNLALAHKTAGQFDEAEALYQESLAMRRQLYGNEHPAIAIALNNLAALHRDRGDAAGALPILNESLAMNRRLFGEPHPQVALNLYNLGLIHTRLGDYPAALETLQAATEQRSALFGPEHQRTAQARGGTSQALMGLGRTAEALEAITFTVRIYERTFGADGQPTRVMRTWQAEAYLQAGDAEHALGGFRRVLSAECAEGAVSSTPDCAVYSLGAAESELMLGGLPAAEQWLAQSEAALPAESWRRKQWRVLRTELQYLQQRTAHHGEEWRKALATLASDPNAPRYVVRRLSARLDQGRGRVLSRAVGRQ